jgi:hypothetical protein
MAFLAATLSSQELYEAPDPLALAGAANIAGDTARLLQHAIDLIWPKSR